MDWLDTLSDFGDGASDPGTTLGGILDIGGGALGSPGTDSSWLSSLISALGGPQAFSTLLGTLGPAVGLAGNLASGGQGPTQTGQTNQSQSNNQTGFQNSVGTQNQQNTSNQTGFQQGYNTNQQGSNTSQTGFQNTTSTPNLDPRSSAAADRLTAMLNPGGTLGATGAAYDQGLQGLMSMAQNGYTGGINAQRPGAPGGVSVDPVTGFPTKMPTDINPELVGLIKQAFGTMTGDIASQAITGARNRGFAGGADLLGTAAAPIAGQALAAVPAKEAEAYLAHVLQAYDLESQNAARRESAEAGATNAAANMGMVGAANYGHDVSAYLGELNAGNSRMNSQIGLMQALMGPNQQAIAANLGLMNALPHGQTQNTLSGGTGTSNLSGFGSNSNFSGSQGTNSMTGMNTNQSQSGSQSNSNSQGNTSGTTQNPFGNMLGQGLANIIGGGAQGYAAGDSGNNQYRDALMRLLRG